MNGVLEVVLNLIRMDVNASTAGSSLIEASSTFDQLPAHGGCEMILQGACQVICEITDVAGVQMEFCRLGGCEIIVEALLEQKKRSTSSLVEWFRMITYLTYDNPKGKHHMVGLGITQSIVKAMKHTNDVGQNRASADHSSQRYVCDPSVVVRFRIDFLLLFVFA